MRATQWHEPRNTTGLRDAVPVSAIARGVGGARTSGPVRAGVRGCAGRGSAGAERRAATQAGGHDRAAALRGDPAAQGMAVWIYEPYPEQPGAGASVPGHAAVRVAGRDARTGSQHAMAVLEAVSGDGAAGVS